MIVSCYWMVKCAGSELEWLTTQTPADVKFHFSKQSKLGFEWPRCCDGGFSGEYAAGGRRAGGRAIRLDTMKSKCPSVWRLCCSTGSSPY